jgi:hypothetical protein
MCRLLTNQELLKNPEPEQPQVSHQFNRINFAQTQPYEMTSPRRDDQSRSTAVGSQNRVQRFFDASFINAVGPQLSGHLGAIR